LFSLGNNLKIFVGILSLHWTHTTFIMKAKIAGKEKLPELSAKLNQDLENSH